MNIDLETKQSLLEETDFEKEQIQFLSILPKNYRFWK